MPEFTLPKGKRERALKLAFSVLSSLDELVAWKITAEPVKHVRSLAQNAYLWAVPNKLISEKTGYEVAEVHEYLLGQYFGWREKRVPKKPSNPKGIESVPNRTTTRNEKGQRDILSTLQFTDYVDFVQRFAAEKVGIVVPDPDPEYMLQKRAA